MGPAILLPLLRGLGRLVGRHPGLPVLVLCAWTLPVLASTELTLAVLAFRDKAETEQRWQATADYLSQSLPGYRVRVVAQTLPEMQQGYLGLDPDFVLAQPTLYIELHHREPMTRLATLVGPGKTGDRFGGVILVDARRTDLNHLTDLKGQRLAAVNLSSLGAYQAQAHTLLQAGIDLRRDARVTFTGQPQDRAVEALLAGQADAAFVRTGVFESLLAEGKIPPGRLKVLAPRQEPGFPLALSTRLYPEWPFAARNRVPEAVQKAVARALLAQPADHPASRTGQYRGWTLAGDYQPLRELLEDLQLPPYDQRRLSLAELWKRYGLVLLSMAGAALAVLTLLLYGMRRLNRELRREMSASRTYLKELEAEQRLFAEGPVAVLVWSAAQGWPVLSASANAATVLGIAGQRLEAPEFRFVDLILPEDLARITAEVEQHQQARRQQWQQTYRIRDDWGQIRWISDFTIAEQDATGQVCQLRGYLIDDTARMALEERLKLLASVFDNAQEGIALTDTRGTILEVNLSFCAITGYLRQEVVGQNPRILSSGRHPSVFYAAMWETLAREGAWQGEIWNRRKNGEVFPELLSITAVTDIRGVVTHYIAVFTDISDLKKQQQKIERLAHYDILTGLPNRALLADRLQMALAQARREQGQLAIAYLDLDGFKPVNDTYGHNVGDVLLTRVARRLTAALRETDTVARLGGDEFVLVLGGSQERNDYLHTLDRVLTQLAEPCPLPEVSVTLSASIGVTFFPDDDSEPDALMRHADQAMYRAKQAGRNRYHIFEIQEERESSLRQENLVRIRRALEQDEFLLYYQPKVDMRRGRVLGMEALIRWQHPDRGLLAPAEFLPLIEDTELELRLGEWVIATALAQLTYWRKLGLDISISINIASPHLLSPEFLPYLSAQLQAYPPLPAGALEIELLESAALADINEVAQVLGSCRKLGLGIALDDFGTGYSSLAYLRRLPADVLKVDQSFVRDMLHDPEDLAIVEGVVGLAQVFHRQVIAEGVESTSHGIMLLHMGCDHAQGYGIARPMPAAAVPGWVRDWTPDPAWITAASLELERAHLPLLLMEVEHRHWVDQMLAYVQAADGTHPRIPPLSSEECNFGRWYHKARELQPYCQDSNFLAMDEVHSRIHRLGQVMVEAISQGRRQDALDRVGELCAAREQLVNLLHQLVAAVVLGQDD